jgi:hypothetical protein
VLSASGSRKWSVVRVLVVPPSYVPGLEMASGRCKIWSFSHRVALRLPQDRPFPLAQPSMFSWLLGPEARSVRVGIAST